MSSPNLYKNNSKPKNFLEALQNAMIRRYLRPYGGYSPVVYEFTEDRALLHQYYRLREAMYQRVHQAYDLKIGEDVHDKLSHILIARRGKLCVGGCRLTIREPDESWDLPVETKEFQLKEVFPNLPLNHVRHGEISRFAIMEDCGDENIFQELCKIMYEKVIDSEIHYLFAKSSYPLARNWRLIANSFGVRSTRICKDVTPPGHPLVTDIDWHLTLSDLSGIYSAKDTGSEKEVPASEMVKVKNTSGDPQLHLIE